MPVTKTCSACPPSVEMWSLSYSVTCYLPASTFIVHKTTYPRRPLPYFTDLTLALLTEYDDIDVDRVAAMFVLHGERVNAAVFTYSLLVIQGRLQGRVRHDYIPARLHVLKHPPPLILLLHVTDYYLGSCKQLSDA